MSGQRYICPSYYLCSCSPGILVSWATVRRHRNLAQARLRHERSDPHLSLPPPTPADEEAYTDLLPAVDVGGRTESSLELEWDGESSDHHGSDAATPRDYPEDSYDSAPTPHNLQDDVGPAIADNDDENDVPQSEAESELSSAADQSILDSLSPAPSTASEIEQEPDNQSELDSEYEVHGYMEGWDDQELASFMNENAWHIGYYLRHSQTLEAMNDLLLHERGETAVCWKTVRNTLERYSGIKVSKHSYCSRSHQALQFDEAESAVVQCDHPHCVSNPLPVLSFMYIRLWERLLVKLQCPIQGQVLANYVQDAYRAQMEDEFAEYQDFYSGQCFREYASTFECFPDVDSILESSQLPTIHLFMFLSTDGAPAFKSSTKSFWPVLLYLGNIPPDERYQRQNVFPVLCIPGYPGDIDSFLEPLFAELERLQEGVQCTLWDGRRAVVKVHLLFVLADLPAMKKVCRIKGVNGVCPCRFCTIAGERSSSGRTYYYPDYIQVSKRMRDGGERAVKRVLWQPHRLPLRKLDKTLYTFREIDHLRNEGDSENLDKLRKSTGIIDIPEVCRRFPAVQPFLSMPIDLMHLLFQNIAPHMVDIWVGTVDTGNVHAYLRTPSILRQVDEVLELSGSGIDDSVRAPRGFRHRGLWKADEWRTFVLTTSLVALDQFLSGPILNGWWLFCQICEISMRPSITKQAHDDLSKVTMAFYKHYSTTYYQGRQDQLHLMKYVVHLLLHVPLSTDHCGPLVCLSQFSTERYIGVIKGDNHAKHKFAESVTIKWRFEHAAMMCERMSGVPISLLKKSNGGTNLDKRSTLSDSRCYEGYWLRGPCESTTLLLLDDRLGCNVVELLSRFYETSFGMSRNSAREFLQNSSEITLWDRLVVQKPTEWTKRKYGRHDPSKRKRSCAFFAGEFETQADDDTVTVFYGQAITFLEHNFVNQDSGEEDGRILVLTIWVTSGLQKGKQNQIFAVGAIDSVLSVHTVEDVSCMARNVAVIQARNYRFKSRIAYRTHFVDDMLMADSLLSPYQRDDQPNKRLCGLNR